ncbi:hypothetical protein UCMB321_0423 [Pseudomonas batumici]|uniref:Uncharacterized protein n=1 Tax=Pseudomonas batumici TaxID=226910 RepID=A0A0C2I9Y6_9PSED|nr:hypothetical protein UCMB321_0423 [Pseudomonas batumici]
MGNQPRHGVLIIAECSIAGTERVCSSLALEGSSVKTCTAGECQV